MINAAFKPIGLIGHPVSHSLSPLMHNSALKACDLNMCYMAFDVPPQHLHASVQGMIALGFVGFNVTIPHKENILPFLDEVDLGARAMGAVNTVVIRDGKTKGYNTDGGGFLASLRDRGIEARGEILVFGAGGAARAVAVAMALEGVQRVTIANRSLENAREISRIVEDLGVKSHAVSLEGGDLKEKLKMANIVVNATPVGMSPRENAPPVFDTAYLKTSAVVCDLVYRPRDTTLLRAARSRGCTTIGGLGMLLYQGAQAFELFTDLKPPIEIMREALAVGL